MLWSHFTYTLATPLLLSMLILRFTYFFTFDFYLDKYILHIFIPCFFVSDQFLTQRKYGQSFNSWSVTTAFINCNLIGRFEERCSLIDRPGSSAAKAAQGLYEYFSFRYYILRGNWVQSVPMILFKSKSDSFQEICTIYADHGWTEILSGSKVVNTHKSVGWILVEASVRVFNSV